VFEPLQRLSRAAEFKAGAGKTYFFRAHVTVGGKDQSAKLSLMPVDAAEGTLLVSKSALSTSKAKRSGGKRDPSEADAR
jgi:hypothetical protein